jgi:hypothetical protein
LAPSISFFSLGDYYEVTVLYEITEKIFKTIKEERTVK